MGLLGDRIPPPEQVLEAKKPAGLADDGTVACVACGRRIPLRTADIVGTGYRCGSCSQRADMAALGSGAADNRTHLDAGDRAAIAKSGAAEIWIGLLLIVGGLAVLGLLATVGFGVGLMVSGIGCVIHGSARVNATR